MEPRLLPYVDDGTDAPQVTPGGAVALSSTVIILAGGLGDGAAVVAVAAAPAAGYEVTDIPADMRAEVEQGLDALQQIYPQITRPEAFRLWAHQESRSSLQVALDAVQGVQGTWFDPPANVMHVLATPNVSRGEIRALASYHGIAIAIDDAKFTLEELEAGSRKIERRLDVTGENPFALRGVTADAARNRIVVGATPATNMDTLWTEIGSDPRVEIDEVPYVAPTVCVSRVACGSPARSGVVIGIDADGAGPGFSTQDRSLGALPSWGCGAGRRVGRGVGVEVFR